MSDISEKQDELQKLKEKKALQLWESFFQDDGEAWVKSPFGVICFFCGKDKPNHSKKCLFLEAENLVKKI